MRICVLVPSEAYRTNAGARIRYGRLLAGLAERNVTLELMEIGQFDPATFDADVLLISKCHDARAQLVAIEACRRGVRVGVDLFDDYFSQRHDPRLTRFRHWLKELAPWLSFAVTSTPAMAEVAASYAPDVPVLVVNDPAAINARGEMIVATADEIAAKRRRVLDEEQLRIGWFGIGDNPYFAVGLSDVAAFADTLASLARLSGFSVRLTILTNSRSMTADGLATIASLPLTYEIEEWSEEAEAALLRDSFACFVPVNAQAFSAAKSLNRAVTALTAGCQLLSAGYPLYSALDPFPYRDVRSLAIDLKADRLRVSAARRDELVELLDKFASADREAGALAEFLENLPGPLNAPTGQVALIHGANTSDATNKLARALEDITVGSPYAPSNLDVDARSQVRVPLAIQLYVLESLVKASAFGQTPSSDVLELGKKRYVSVSAETAGPAAVSTFDLAQCGLGVQLALYDAVIDAVRDHASTELEVSQFVISESSAIPFAAVRQGLNK